MSDNKNKKTKPHNVKKKISHYLKCERKKKKNENVKWVALENKKGQQKLTCVVCNSRKSTF